MTGRTVDRALYMARGSLALPDDATVPPKFSAGPPDARRGLSLVTGWADARGLVPSDRPDDVSVRFGIPNGRTVVWYYPSGRKLSVWSSLKPLGSFADEVRGPLANFGATQRRTRGLRGPPWSAVGRSWNRCWTDTWRPGHLADPGAGSTIRRRNSSRRIHARPSRAQAVESPILMGWRST